jgi:hypothetical protein
MITTWSTAALKQVLTNATGGTGILNAGKIALFEDTVPIQPNAVLADLTPATFTGYAPKGPIVFGTIHSDAAGNAVCMVLPQEFKPTGTGPSSIVRQVGLLNTAGDTLVISAMLDEPLNFVSVESVFHIGFKLVVGQPVETAEEIIP